MKLTMLGIGHAVVYDCYNTCYVIEDEGQYFLVDAGGGKAILSQLKRAGIDWHDIHDIFVTHRHTDHILGMFWLIRLMLSAMKRGRFTGEVRIYGNQEVIQILDTTSRLLFPESCAAIGQQLHFITVNDGQQEEVIGHPITFFDIHSSKALQYGYCLDMGQGQKLTCCGDEPFSRYNEAYALGSKWLLHEAFCLYEDWDIYHPYRMSHSTAKDAGLLAEELKVTNLLLYHTEESDLAHRKERYTAEAKTVYHGNVVVPEELEVVEL